MELKIDNAAIEKLVKEHVAASIATVLSKNSDYLIQSLVKSAMEAKSERSYGNKSIMDEKIEALIRDEANNAIKEWLDSKRATIKKLVFDACSKKSDGLVATVVENLVASMKNLRVEVYMSGKDNR